MIAEGLRTGTERALPEVGRVLQRTLARGPVAGPDVADALRAAVDAVGSGRRVALEHVPGRGEDPVAGTAALIGRVAAARLADSCTLTLRAGRVPGDALRDLARTAAAAGLGVVLAGPAAEVDQLIPELPDAGIEVPAGEPGAEDRCRELGARAVRLVEGRGAAADLAFVRCLNVLMNGPGRPGVAATDSRLIAIAGERAAWNDRSPESWEYVMPWRVRTEEQQRLVAAGAVVRAVVLSGRGAPSAAVRRLVGRS